MCMCMYCRCVQILDHIHQPNLHFIHSHAIQVATAASLNSPMVSFPLLASVTIFGHAVPRTTWLLPH